MDDEAAHPNTVDELHLACVAHPNEDVYTWAGPADTWHVSGTLDKCTKEVMYKTSTGSSSKAKSELQTSHDGCCDAALRTDDTNNQMIYSCVRATETYVYYERDNDTGLDTCLERSTATWPSSVGGVSVSPTGGWTAPTIEDTRTRADCCTKGYVDEDIDLLRACRPYKLVPTFTPAVTLPLISVAPAACGLKIEATYSGSLELLPGGSGPLN